MLAVYARRDARCVGAKARDQRLAQPLRLHHVVHDEVGRELVEVDVLAVLVLELLATRLALVLRQPGQLVVEDRVDRRLRAHDRDLC